MSASMTSPQTFPRPSPLSGLPERRRPSAESKRQTKPGLRCGRGVDGDETSGFGGAPAYMRVVNSPGEWHARLLDQSLSGTLLRLRSSTGKPEEALQSHGFVRQVPWQVGRGSRGFRCI